MAQIKRKHLVIIAVTAIALIVTVSILRKPKDVHTDAGEGPKSVPVEIAEAQKGDIEALTVISGKLEALYRVNVAAKVSGRVKEVTSEVGQRIKNGDILFVIDDSDIRSQLDQARAGLFMARANFEQNKERFENAKKDLERGELLFEQGALSEQTLEQMRAAASDSGLRVLEAQLAQAEASYELVSKQYEECHVKSPIDGVVAYINVNVGESVAPGVPAAVVVDMSAVVLEGTIGESLINHVEKEGTIDVSIPSVGHEAFAGTIREISPAADQRTGLFGLKVLIENPEETIKPGMFAEAGLIKDSKKDVVHIPTAALIAKNGEQYVYIVEKDKAVQREVITGIAGDGVVEIINGIKQGEKVIIKGQNYLEDGDDVRIVRGDSR